MLKSAPSKKKNNQIFTELRLREPSPPLSSTVKYIEQKTNFRAHLQLPLIPIPLHTAQRRINFRCSETTSINYHIFWGITLLKMTQVITVAKSVYMLLQRWYLLHREKDRLFIRKILVPIAVLPLINTVEVATETQISSLQVRISFYDHI